MSTTTRKFKTVITKTGAAKLAQAVAPDGKPVRLTHMAVGDGGGTLPTPDSKQTCLVHEVWRHTINRVTLDTPHPNRIIAELVIPPETGGFWIREIGVFDEHGDLIAVGNTAESYKPTVAEGSGRAQTFRTILTVSSAATVELTVDNTMVMATVDYVDDKLKEHERSRNHPDATLDEKGFTQLSSETDSSSEDKSATPKAVKAVMDETQKKAPLDSPALTGNPTAPTPDLSATGLEIANAAFVAAKVAQLVDSSPEAMDTLKELADALGNDPNFATTMLNALAGKQPLDATLTNLSGKDVAGLLQYLDLVETIKLAAGALQRTGGKISGDLEITGITSTKALYTPKLFTQRSEVPFEFGLANQTTGPQYWDIHTTYPEIDYDYRFVFNSNVNRIDLLHKSGYAGLNVGGFAARSIQIENTGRGEGNSLINHYDSSGKLVMNYGYYQDGFSINFYDANGAWQSNPFFIGRNGNASVSGNLSGARVYEGGTRVYSPNNPPPGYATQQWVLQNFVQNIDLTAPTEFQFWDGRGYMRATDGAAMYNFSMVGGSSNVGWIVIRYTRKLVNNTWYVIN